MNLHRSFSRLCIIVLIAVAPHTFTYAQTSAAKQLEKPYTVEYYYKVRWGFQNEFIRLFKQNHYPVLKKEMELGRIIQVTATTPIYHFTEDANFMKLINIHLMSRLRVRL